MLAIPTHGQPLTVVGIDPGTSSLGVSHLTWDFTSPTFNVQNAFSFALSNTDAAYAQISETHGNRMARLQQIRDHLTSYLREVGPHVVISESPFMGKFAASFKALSECLLVVQQSVMDYDMQIPLMTASPYEVKQAAGVSLKGKKGRGKDDIREALLQNPRLVWMLDPHPLDEHAIDATAVGLHYLRSETGL